MARSRVIIGPMLTPLSYQQYFYSRKYVEWVIRGLVILPNGEDVLFTGPLVLYKLRDDEDDDDVVVVDIECCECNVGDGLVDRSALLPPVLDKDDEDDDEVDDDDVEPTEPVEDRDEESRSILPSGGRARP